MARGLSRGRSQEFATGGTKRGLGDGSPPADFRGKALVGIWGRSPQKPETNANLQLRRGHAPMSPLLGYASGLSPIWFRLFIGFWAHPALRWTCIKTGQLTGMKLGMHMGFNDRICRVLLPSAPPTPPTTTPSPEVGPAHSNLALRFAAKQSRLAI